MKTTRLKAAQPGVGDEREVARLARIWDLLMNWKQGMRIIIKEKGKDVYYTGTVIKCHNKNPWVIHLDVGDYIDTTKENSFYRKYVYGGTTLTRKIKQPIRNIEKFDKVVVDENPAIVKLTSEEQQVSDDLDNDALQNRKTSTILHKVGLA